MHARESMTTSSDRPLDASAPPRLLSRQSKRECEPVLCATRRECIRRQPKNPPVRRRPPVLSVAHQDSKQFSHQQVERMVGKEACPSRNSQCTSPVAFASSRTSRGMIKSSSLISSLHKVVILVPIILAQIESARCHKQAAVQSVTKSTSSPVKSAAAALLAPPPSPKSLPSISSHLPGNKRPHFLLEALASKHRMDRRQEGALMQGHMWPQDLSTGGNELLHQQNIQYQQQSPLTRAIAATRLLARQHQSGNNDFKHDNQASSRLPTLIQSLVGRTNGVGTLEPYATDFDRFQQQSAPSTDATAAGRFVRFLHNVKQQARQQRLLARNSSSQDTAGPLLAHSLEPGEPFQSAPSESSLERAPGSLMWALPRGDSRSIITLSAPYEQQARVLSSTSANRSRLNSVNLVTSASGQHHQTASLNNQADSYEPPAVEGQPSSGANETEPSEAGEQQASQEPGESYELSYLDSQQQQQQQQQQIAMAHNEEQQRQFQEQQQQQQHQMQQALDGAGAQWNATGQALEGSQELAEAGHPAEEQQENQEQSDNGQQQQQQQQQAQQTDDSSLLPGEEPQEPDQQQHQHQQVESANAYGRAIPVEAEFGQRPTDSSHGSDSYGASREQTFKLENATAGYLLPMTTTTNMSIENSHPAANLLPQVDESSLVAAAQLPSQYDSMIRVPPEGHYDDYFKLMGTSGGAEGGPAASAALPARDSGGPGAQQARFVTVSSSDQQQAPRQPNATSERQVATNATAGGQTLDSGVSYQYFMDQQRLFAASSAKSPLGGANASQFAEYPTQGSAASVEEEEAVSQRQRYQMIGATTNQTQRGEEQQVGVASQATLSSGNHHYQQQNHSANGSGGQLGAAEQDNVQLIVANSAANLQDPSTNEKVITYTSEAGRNFARLVGKPARHTFFNKDLNESPPPSSAVAAPTRASTSGPADTPTQHDQTSGSRDDDSSLPSTRAAISKFKVRSTRSPDLRAKAGSHGSRNSTKLVARETAAGSGTTPRSDLVGETFEEDVATPPSASGYLVPLADDAQLVHLPEGADDKIAVQFGQYSEYAAALGHGPPPLRRPLVGHREDSRREPSYRAPMHNKNANIRQPYHHRPSESRPGKNQHKSEQKAHRHHQRHLSKQQTVGRPQVTEAKFELADLALSAPTAMPTVAESTVKSMEELPGKVRRLRDHQVDKNELMNELLTALDRVKSAIYKLQPLTAKMNAMYRKSVTANTRDQILESNKGTYSKRYPPGDFDETYDRMHPSELLEHQQRLSSRGGRSFSSANRSRQNGTDPESSPSSPAQRRRRHQLSAEHRAGRNRTRPSSSETAAAAATHDLDDAIEPSDSRTTAVYVPAPRDMLAGGLGTAGEHKNATTTSSSERTAETPASDEADRGESSPQILIASGIGRRIGGTLRGRLSLKSAFGAETIIYDDDSDAQTLGDTNSSRSSTPAPEDDGATKLSRRSGDLRELIRDEATQASAPGKNWTAAGDADGAADRAGSLFGYRITIYQTPESGEDEDGNSSASASTNAADAQILSYGLLDDGDTERGSVVDSDGAQVSFRSSPAARSGEGGDDGNGDDDDDDDLMATSESSLVPTGGASGQLDVSESQRASRTKMAQAKKAKKAAKKEDKSDEEEEEKKKEHKAEEGQKKGAKWSKHQARGKKGEEEHKKKKEFKKIKHHKGVLSKESHKLHRDKHIKAHDRGAAKEKALKERTQIEFFEREQIVDDEFEKGKKSSVKAGWASGHDAKKSSLDIGAGGGGGHESMSMGGSSYVNHLESPPSPGAASAGSAAAASAASPMLMAASEGHSTGDHGGGLSGKGHGHSSESSSGKQSNKYEKRQMEARGKKFKGWREKGYKIITETEFIDRGSLHDSAYKKRDKGAAHHQKFKKHEAKSEGHHGSMHEHHKKSHKKEEKKSKSEEKKKELGGKEAEGQQAKRRKKKTKQQAQKEEEMAKKMKKKKDEVAAESSRDEYDQEESAPTVSSLGQLPQPAPPTTTSAPPRATSGPGGAPLNKSNATGGSQLAQATTLKPTFVALASTSAPSPKPTRTLALASSGAANHQVSTLTSVLSTHDNAALARHRYVTIANASDPNRAPSYRSASWQSILPGQQRTDNEHLSPGALDRINGSNRRQDLAPATQLGLARVASPDESSSPLLRLVSSLAKLDKQRQQSSQAKQQEQQRASAMQQVAVVGGGAHSAASPRLEQQQAVKEAPVRQTVSGAWQSVGANQEPNQSRSVPNVKRQEQQQRQPLAINSFDQSRAPHFESGSEHLAAGTQNTQRGRPSFPSQSSQVLLRPQQHQKQRQSPAISPPVNNPPNNLPNNIFQQQQQRQRFYLAQPLSAYLQAAPVQTPSPTPPPPPIHFQGADSGAFSFMEPAPFDGLAGLEPFDYEQPALDTTGGGGGGHQFLGPSGAFGAAGQHTIPRGQFVAPQLQHFNFLTDR